MKRRYRILSLLLTLGVLLSMLGESFVFVHAQNDVSIVHLKVEDEVNPLCVDSAAPRFSWQMHSGTTGQKQTAYRIVVAGDAAFNTVVWDSGKVMSDVSVGIPYMGRELSPSTCYYWKVTVSDMDGVDVSSDTAWFETGLMGGASAWGEADWIRAGAKTVPVPSDAFHYTVSGEFTCQNTAVGLIFNALDNADFYMWQLQFENNRVVVRPHLHSATGGWNAYGEVYRRDITDLVGGVENFKTTPVKMLIDVTKNEIKTYINNTLVVTIPASEAGGIGPYLGKIGVRSNEDSRGTVANLKMIDYTDDAQGVVVYDYDFSKMNPFYQGTVEDGKFIVSNVGELIPPDGTSVFRKEVLPDAEKTIEKVKLYSSALGVYDLFCNGQRVGGKNADGSMVYDELKPGYTQPGERVYYFAYDITDSFLSEGPNTLSAMVTSGWWSGNVVKRAGLCQPAFLARLEISYTDGTKQLVCTDTSWKSSYESPVRMADIYLGETYDARVDTGWKNSGYNDSDWGNAVVSTEFNGEILAAVPGIKVRVREDLELSPQSITVYDGVVNATDTQYGEIHITGNYQDGDSFELGAGEKAIFDLGQNFAGWPEIQVEGDRGTMITMRHAEMLNDQDGLLARGNDGPEGTLYLAALRTADATGRYILNGEGIETYHASHTYYGFRYVEVSASAPVQIYGLKGQVITSVAEDTGKLTTSDERVNRLSENMRWGQYGNYNSIPSACPQRDEREGWTADAHAFSTTSMYYGNNKSLLSKWTQDIRDAQRDSDGAYPEIAPSHNYDFWLGQAGWAEAGIIVPYNLYKMYGDKRIIEENWDAMQKFMDVYMASTDREGGGLAFGDWLSYESNDTEIRRMVAVAYYAWSAQMMAEMAGVLGKTEDAARYEAVYQTEKAYFQQCFVNADGSLKRTEQTACLLALKIDLLPDAASWNTVKKALIDSIQKYGDRLQTGFIGTSIILTTLSEIGASDVAYRLLLQDENPSWLYSVDQGATTVWERWNSYTKESGFGDAAMNSFNHIAYGTAGEWMFGYMAGIQYDMENPGFKHILLQPEPNQFLTYVDCSYRSPYGTIVSNWKYEGEQLIYNAVVPANSTSTVSLPVEDGKSVLVNGKPADEVTLERDGVVYVKTEEGKAVFHTLSGSFGFVTGVTAQYVISFDTAGENPAYPLDCLVKIDGGPLQSMPNQIKVGAGESVTVEAFAQNGADYSFDCWSGDAVAEGNKITLTAQKNSRLVANFQWTGYESLALGAVVSSNNIFTHESWLPEYLVDGALSPLSGHIGYSSNALDSDAPSVKPWIQLDLGEVMEFDRIHLYPRMDMFSSTGSCNFPIDCTVEVSDDASSWTVIAAYSGDAPYKAPLVILPDGGMTAGRYLRLTVNRVSGVADDGMHRVQLTEFGVYNTSLSTPWEMVVDRIRRIGSIDLSSRCEKRIAAIRAAYDALDADARALVTNYADLTRAEAEQAALLAGVRKLDNAAEVTAISGPGAGGESFDKMLDGRSDTKFGSSAYTTPFIWQTGQPVTASGYSITTGFDSGTFPGRNPTSWRLYGCNDWDGTGGTWIEIAVVDGNYELPDANSVEVRFSISDPAAYRYYKLELPAQGDKWMQITEFALYTNVSEAGADYTEVDAAIGEAPAAADRVKYTPESLRILDDAIAAVVRGKTAGEQAVVDGYAAAIRKAVSGLVTRVEAVEGLLEAMPADEELTKDALAEKRVAVEAAKAAYDALPEDQKTLVDSVLVDAMERKLEILAAGGIENFAKRGDMNNDGKLTVSDVVALRAAIVAGEEAPAGDMNSDGKLTVSDVVALRAAIVAG